jgi:hypothetical protein
MTLTRVAQVIISNSQTALVNEREVLTQISFYCALIFLIIYSVRTPWWNTVHGRTLVALAMVFITVLLRPMFVYWNIIGIEDLRPGPLDWLAVSAMALAPLAFLTMTWQLLRKPLRQVANRLRDRRGDDPLTQGAPPKLGDNSLPRRRRGES